jgi:hypothetical protein
VHKKLTSIVRLLIMRYREILESTTVLTELNTPSNTFNVLLRHPAAEQAVVALIAAEIAVPVSP